MNSYLKGYLEVLPKSQRIEVERVLQNYDDLFNTVYTEEEFKRALATVAEKHEPLSKLLLQTDRLDSEIHNQIGANMQVDLNYLFHNSLLLEKITASYDHIFDGMLADMQKEVTALGQQIDAIHFIKKGEVGLILRGDDFTSQANREIYTEETAYLFCDRNGKELPVAPIERTHDQYNLQIQKTRDVNAIMNERGEITAKIEVVDRRGTPLPTISEDYVLSNAMDGSSQTYWADIVITDEPIQMTMPK
ncbi:hypothetical protein_gp077 [Bacillus phage vB_BceM_WH1]|nr:hypothetical protein_gp077 [Bacillus phage vB_BceM_WH1]